jgi:hypothetical protein
MSLTRGWSRDGFFLDPHASEDFSQWACQDAENKRLEEIIEDLVCPGIGVALGEKRLVSLEVMKFFG